MFVCFITVTVWVANTDKNENTNFKILGNRKLH
jgi:hypothetical protein